MERGNSRLPERRSLSHTQQSRTDGGMYFLEHARRAHRITSFITEKEREVIDLQEISQRLRIGFRDNPLELGEKSLARYMATV